jgi:hypothetical protein
MTGEGARHPAVGPTGRASTMLAAVLVLASAGLQQRAALERWPDDGRLRGGHSIQSHLFDYTFPADPWESLGVAAELIGIGYLLLACALPLAFADARSRGDRAVIPAVVGAAGSFGYLGVHALVSGLLDAPTVLQSTLVAAVPGLLAPVSLVALVVLHARPRPVTAAACALLLGATLPGHLVAMFFVAPVIVGFASHDTTPWTESVVAAWTALAGILLLVAAASRGRADGRGGAPTPARPAAGRGHVARADGRPGGPTA